MATIPGKSDNLNSTLMNITHTHTHTRTQDQIDGLEDINQLLLSQTTLAQSEVSVTIVTKYHSNRQISIHCFIIELQYNHVLTL